MTTAACPCTMQDPMSSTHIHHISCPRSELDPWHYTGNTTFFTDEKRRTFINTCKQKFPQKQLSIKVGDTGYVSGTNDIYHQSNAWCFDEHGRVVILFDGALIFQRYVHGDRLMMAHQQDSYDLVNDDDLRKFTALLGS